jgi:hypothetical protein
MSLIIKTSIKAVSVDGWNGFKIVRPDGTTVRTLAVFANEAGEVRASKSSKAVPDEQLLDLGIDEAEDGKWLWPLLHGRVDDNVLEALNLAGMDETAKADFADSVLTHASKLSVDHRAISILVKTANPRLSLIAFYSGEGDRPENRRQQAAIYPIFADYLASRLQLKMTIDRKDGSLAEKLASSLSTDAYTVTPAMLKRFAQAEGVPDGCDVASMMLFAHAVPADWLPKGGDDFESFAHIATAVVETFSDPLEYIPALIKGCGGKWNDLLNKIVKSAYPPPRKPKSDPSVAQIEGPVAPSAAVAPGSAVAMVENPADIDPNYVPPPPRPLAVRYSLRGMHDMILQYTDNVVIPMAAHRQGSNEVYISPDLRDQAERQAQRILLGGRTIAEIADISRRFHQEQYRILEGSPILQKERMRYVAAASGEGWPGLTREVQAPNGLWIVPLKTTGQLKDEGKKLSHCVGGYTAQAERCSSHIVSVRSLDDNGAQSLSTCEIEGISGPSGPFKSRQHYTTGNTTPSPAAQQALGWYLTSLAAGEIPVHWNEIKIFKSNDAKKADSIERFCKYDWRDPDMLFEATVPWFPVLPKSFRDVDLEGLVDYEGMEDVSSIIPPDMVGLRR